MALNAARGRISSVFAAAGAAAAAAAAPAVASVGAPAAAAAAARAADSVVLVNCTMSNVHVCVSTLDGNVVSKASSGMLGYKHRLRNGPMAGKEVAELACKKAFESGHRLAHVHVKGPSRSRSVILRGILSGGLEVKDIRDVTPIPTNGCRPKHARRL